MKKDEEEPEFQLPKVDAHVFKEDQEEPPLDMTYDQFRLWKRK